MIQKPQFLSSKYSEQFKDKGIVDAYHYRPPYPVEIFDILSNLVNVDSRRVLDVGCGTGNIARNLVSRVEQLDAVDFSLHMLENGKRLSGGNNPHLHWLHGRVEDVVLDPPYGLVTAGESLHWMDWNVVLPRFHEVLTDGGYLAIVEHDITSNPWYATLREIIPHYSTNKDFQYFDMIAALQQHGLFQKVGEQKTAPVPFVQSIDDYIESFHSRNGFSRERMGTALADAFDKEAREILFKSYRNGVISVQIVGSVVWGIPKAL